MEEREESFSHEIARLQRRIDRHLRRYMEKQVAQTGVYQGQHMILMMVGCNPGISQAQLAKARDISPAAATNALQKLEKEGYVTRQTDEQDSRVNQLQVTPKGKKVIEDSKLIFQEVDDAMYEGFSQEELEQLKSYYERILTNLKNRLKEET